MKNRHRGQKAHCMEGNREARNEIHTRQDHRPVGTARTAQQSGLGPRLIRMENNKTQTLPCTGCKINSSMITISRVKNQTTTYRDAIRGGSSRQQGGKTCPAPVLQTWGASGSPGGPGRSRMLGPTLGFLIYQVWNLHF